MSHFIQFKVGPFKALDKHYITVNVNITYIYKGMLLLLLLVFHNIQSIIKQ